MALAADGTPLNRLSVDLAARMPRAVSINVDLSGVSTGHRILLLAVVGSTNDLKPTSFNLFKRMLVSIDSCNKEIIPKILHIANLLKRGKGLLQVKIYAKI